MTLQRAEERKRKRSDLRGTPPILGSIRDVCSWGSPANTSHHPALNHKDKVLLRSCSGIILGVCTWRTFQPDRSMLHKYSRPCNKSFCFKVNEVKLRKHLENANRGLANKMCLNCSVLKSTPFTTSQPFKHRQIQQGLETH